MVKRDSKRSAFSELSCKELAILFNENHLFKIAGQKLCVDGRRHRVCNDKRKPKPPATSRPKKKRLIEGECSELSLKKIRKEGNKESKKERDRMPETRDKKSNGNVDSGDEDTDIEDLSDADTKIVVSSDSDNTIGEFNYDYDDEAYRPPQLTRQHAILHPNQLFSKTIHFEQ